MSRDVLIALGPNVDHLENVWVLRGGEKRVRQNGRSATTTASKRGQSNERQGRKTRAGERSNGKDARSRRKQKGVAGLSPNRHVRHPIIYSQHLT